MLVLIFTDSALSLLQPSVTLQQPLTHSTARCLTLREQTVHSLFDGIRLASLAF